MRAAVAFRRAFHYCRTLASRHREAALEIWRESDSARALLSEFYGIEEAFDWSCVYSRGSANHVRLSLFSETKTLYWVHPTVRSLCLAADSTLRTLHTGLKLFEHSNRNAVCPFRLCQEGIAAVLPSLRKRVVRVGAADWLVLLANRTEAKGWERFSEAFRVDETRSVDA